MEVLSGPVYLAFATMQISLIVQVALYVGWSKKLDARILPYVSLSALFAITNLMNGALILLAVIQLKGWSAVTTILEGMKWK